MSAPITSSAPARTANKSSSKAQTRGGATQGKKTRVVRRRGRAKGIVDSDDEIEREARTDSESEDDISSMEDSGSESESEDIITHSHPRTPSSSQSPQEAPPIPDAKEAASFFGSSGNWSEMVADETTNGPADLPVIDFSELDSHIVPVHVHVPARKQKKTHKKQRSAASVTQASPVATVSVDDHGDSSAAPTPNSRPNRSFPRRPHGQSARQAYQERLESDPSYVPTVGEFWGHDDRLLDKNLRSLSNWWRGRWQGRGRGRGFVRGGSKGGFMGGGSIGKVDQANGDVEESAEAPEVPPVERTWTHDGFEEMKRNEERRRAQQQTQSQQPFRGAANTRGRGGFSLRGGRGGRGGFNSILRSHSPSGGSRVWYVMKPERMWTKQSELFLYLDPSLKPRSGQAAGIRVKLPGERSQATKLPLKELAAMSSPKPAVTSTTSISGSDYGGNKIVVRLPKQSSKKSADVPDHGAPKDEPSLDEVFTVRPRLVSPKPIPLPDPSSSKAPVNLPNSTHAAPLTSTQPALDLTAQQKLEQVSVQPQSSDPQRRAQTEEAVLRNPSSEVNRDAQNAPTNDARPELPPIQTSFTPPVPQGSPAYGSPYAYPPPLPPGVAVNSMGMPYEVATGRPVYLPVPTMYDPRSMMPPPAAPFVPGHMHHRSLSDFNAQPSPPPQSVNGFIDYNTGQPFFSFPRQSSRVQIRPPDGYPFRMDAAGSKKEAGKPSGLRSSAIAFEPTRTEDGFFTAPQPSEEGNGEGTPGEEPTQPDARQMTGYDPYQHQYYYPDAYNYNPYMDMPQMGQYGMYPQDHIPQGTVYY
uniref:Btz domain-containing protein n=1 Tax=Moniliophthora roreri TaxID=221103 RepID=A0A0W0GB34_MONRR